ncbi:MAG: trypsin-like peptidase domain-containing protein [Bacteroidales bacterium]|nr:trypsin-like peptidase domain-containing protein [Bacteroidales bacterium]
MHRIILTLLLVLLAANLFAQVRFGWRSIYDTSGRLSRMNYYVNGVSVPDSNYFFQYYTGNVLKAIVRGEITPNQGCKTGSVMLFDEAGSLTSYSVKRNGQNVFTINCDNSSQCLASWSDQFDTYSGCWGSDSIGVAGGKLLLSSNKTEKFSIFESPLPIDLSNDFELHTVIPTTEKTSRLGVVLGWKDEKNYLVIEILYGEYYSISLVKDGQVKQYGDTRIPISKKNQVENEVSIIRKNKDLIFEINNSIETVMSVPDFAGSKIGFISRSRGEATFDNFVFRQFLNTEQKNLKDYWVGRGSGFFISTTGRILTTYDVVSGAGDIRVKGYKNGKAFSLPAVIVGEEEETNLVILQVTDKSFSPFTQLPFGYTNIKPISESTVFSVGYPGAASDILINPEYFSGKVIPASASSTNMLIEMPFRYGMIGSPIFDTDANLVGIVSNRGLEIKYTEAIDFLQNARLLQGYMGRTERIYESPNKRSSQKKMVKALMESVVIIESNIFNTNNNGY